jgi:hypothetical protein
MEKKRNKILSFIFLIVLINSSIIYSIRANEQSNYTIHDDIDQQQTQSDIFEEIYGDIYIGQSFRPKLGNLTRVRLLLSKNGYVDFNITVGIREELTKKDFINISILPTDITSQEQWIEINFSNIELNTEGNLYYIICTTKNGDKNNNYRWHANAVDTYTNGTQYYTNNSGKTWSQNISRDLCFITYGKEIIKETQLRITYLRGRSGKKIELGLENEGETDINNIEVNLAVEVGLLLQSNRVYKENIDTLKAGQPAKIIFYILVLRPIVYGNIKVSATVENINTIYKTYNVFFFFSYIYISS